MKKQKGGFVMWISILVTIVELPFGSRRVFSANNVSGCDHISCCSDFSTAL